MKRTRKTSSYKAAKGFCVKLCIATVLSAALIKAAVRNAMDRKRERHMGLIPFGVLRFLELSLA
jgi:hypothetical protein